MSTYEAAKARLFDLQRPSDVAIGFVDDPVVMRHLDAAPARHVTFGRSNADYHLAGDELRGPTGTIATVAFDAAPAAARHHQRARGVGARRRVGSRRPRGCRPRDRVVRRAAAPHRAGGRARRRAVVQRLQGDDTARRGRGDPRVRARRAHRRRAQQGPRPVADGRRARTPPVGRGDRRVGRRDHRRSSRRTAAVVRADSMEAAVVAAADSARRGDAVLLSPGCASFDWYPSGGYTARGDHFRRLVAELVDVREGGTDERDRSTHVPSTRRARCADRRRAAAGGARAAAGIAPASRAGPGAAATPTSRSAALGPPPVAYYVIVVVVAVFVMLGLVMVLSSSAATEVGKGNSPYRIFSRQLMWAGFGLVGMLVAVKVPYRRWRPFDRAVRDPRRGRDGAAVHVAGWAPRSTGPRRG